MYDGHACYSCFKLGRMVKDCPNRKSQEQGKERVQPNGPNEKAQGGNDSSYSSLGVQGKAPLVKSHVRSLN